MVKRLTIEGELTIYSAAELKRAMVEPLEQQSSSFCKTHGIRVVSESLFGIGYRQIIFEVSTGHVWSRRVKPKPSDPVEPRRT